MAEATKVIEKQKEFSFDTDALKTKYQEEREKRLRKDGINQFRTVDEAALHHYVDDPYATADTSRDPLEEEVDFLIIGGGFGGLLVAARLREVGITNIRIVDKAADFGGTWYWNRYPGLSCDIESYIYMPLLEELNYIPTEKYAKGSEIFEYARSVGRHYDLYSKALLQTEVISLNWDGEVWVANTDRKDCIRARFVATAGGVLHKPKLPGIPGIELFKGQSFHTSRWNWDYTGGNTEGGLDRLKDKRVGVIGTGKCQFLIVTIVS
jgi:cyclohexanone monooxygenase